MLMHSENAGLLRLATSFSSPAVTGLLLRGGFIKLGSASSLLRLLTG